MKILIDSWTYQPVKYVAIAIWIVMLLVIAIANIGYIQFSGNITGLLLSAVLLMVLGALSLYLGVFTSPVKICDEGVLFQPRLNIKSLLIPFDEIGKIGFAFSLPSGNWEGFSECTVSYRSGAPITSAEMFTMKSLERFVNDARPELEKKGFRFKKNDRKGVWFTEFIFERT